jgi:hypothetical protein
LLGFLDKAEPLSLLFLCPLHGSRRCCTSGGLSGTARVTTSFAFTQISLRTGNFPLTYIYLRKFSFTAFICPLFCPKIHW